MSVSIRGPAPSGGFYELLFGIGFLTKRSFSLFIRRYRLDLLGPKEPRLCLQYLFVLSLHNYLPVRIGPLAT